MGLQKRLGCRTDFNPFAAERIEIRSTDVSARLLSPWDVGRQLNQWEAQVFSHKPGLKKSSVLLSSLFFLKVQVPFEPRPLFFSGRRGVHGPPRHALRRENCELKLVSQLTGGPNQCVVVTVTPS